MKKNRLFKGIALAAAVALCAGLAGGCSTKENMEESGQVSLKVGDWLNKSEWPKEYALNEERVNEMREKYPNITIIPDEWGYSTDSFLPSAASGQIPDLYTVPFTEMPKIVKAGYAADLTEKFKEYGYDTAIKDSVLNSIEIDGKYYAIPFDGYIIGMMFNVELFKEAGLIDEKGRPIYPTNYDELRDTAVKIKEKTGKAGFSFPTVDAEGGWMLMSMAWSFGVDFMEQIDGKWTATFDSPEMVNLMQYISDLKWKYDVLPENILLSRDDEYQLFATNQVACMFAAGDWADGIIRTYGMSKDNISNAPVPAGAAGACTQIGGKLYVIAPNATEEQIDAAFKWISMKGQGMELSDSELERTEKDIKINQENGLVISNDEFSVFKDAKCIEQKKKIKEKYINVNPEIWNTMYSDKLILKSEEPVCAQELYRVLSPMLQEVLVNKNVDIPSMIKKANDNFQKDFLDKNAN